MREKKEQLLRVRPRSWAVATVPGNA